MLLFTWPPNASWNIAHVCLCFLDTQFNITYHLAATSHCSQTCAMSILYLLTFVEIQSQPVQILQWHAPFVIDSIVRCIHIDFVDSLLKIFHFFTWFSVFVSVAESKWQQLTFYTWLRFFWWFSTEHTTHIEREREKNNANTHTETKIRMICQHVNILVLSCSWQHWMNMSFSLDHTVWPKQAGRLPMLWNFQFIFLKFRFVFNGTRKIGQITNTKRFISTMGVFCCHLYMFLWIRYNCLPQ